MSKTKPEKPTADFPLFAMGNGQWAKKIKGKICYFGPWDDPQTALAKYKQSNGQPLGGNSQSTKNTKSATTRKGSPQARPKKPHKDYPLFAHANGQWAKKILGKLHYFGLWRDPQVALQVYLEEKDDLLAGQAPRISRDGLTIRELLNRFLNSKQRLLEVDEITNRTFEGYKLTSEWVAHTFGLNTLVEDLAMDDFEKLRHSFAQRYGPVGRGNEINKTRIIFKFAFDAGLIEKPVRYGQNFKRPKKKVLREHRNAQAARMFEADELRKLIASANVQLRAMILLGINCGFGNADIGTLPISAIDLERGWHAYARPKTGVKRRAPLWPETVEAVREAIVARPKTKLDKDADLVFLTNRGGSWHRDTPDNPLSKEMTKLLTRLKLKRPRVNFYALRHTFETIAGETRDQVAVDHIMGHARDDMASVYRERISDERLVAVTEFVRRWLFGDRNDS